jgi:hypothetical protein
LIEETDTLLAECKEKARFDADIVFKLTVQRKSDGNTIEDTLSLTPDPEHSKTQFIADLNRASRHPSERIDAYTTHQIGSITYVAGAILTDDRFLRYRTEEGTTAIAVRADVEIAWKNLVASIRRYESITVNHPCLASPRHMTIAISGMDYFNGFSTSNDSNEQTAKHPQVYNSCANDVPRCKNSQDDLAETPAPPALFLHKAPENKATQKASKYVS